MIIITFIIILLMISSFYFGMYRNTEVYAFRGRVRELCLTHAKTAIDKRESDFLWSYRTFLDNGPTYRQMVFSFKPLKLNKWYKIEDLEKLLS